MFYEITVTELWVAALSAEVLPSTVWAGYSQTNGCDWFAPPLLVSVPSAISDCNLWWFKLTCIMLKQTSSTHIVKAALQDRCGKYLVSRSGEEPNVLGGGFLSIFKYITKNLSGTDLSTGKEPQCFWSHQDFAVEWSKDLSRHDILQPVIKLKRSLQRSVIHHV